MKYAIVVLLICAACFAQDNSKGQLISINPGPPPQAVSSLNFYSGGDLIYRCQAVSIQPTFTWYVSSVVPPGSTLTSIVVNTNVGTVTTVGDHGLQVGNKITVAGSTTAALNGVYSIATVPTTSTFTIATSGVSNATYNTSALKFYTTAPRSNAAIWSVHAYTYSSSNLTVDQWANGSTSMNQICDNRASLYYQ